MRWLMNNRTLSWLLLIYFAVYVIPPTSSFANTAVLPEPARADAPAIQDPRHIRLYLRDIILWRQLKRIKHSDKQSGILSRDERGFEIDMASADITGVGLGAVAGDLPGTSWSEYKCDISHQSRTADIRYVRSGISPPLFQ
jgi:hypothetical protein